MPQQDIKKIIQDEVRRQYSTKQFGQSPLPRHVHNGIDAPPVFNPTRIYAGYVPSNGDVFSSDFQMLPKGWTAELGVGNVYTITHNLGTEFYSVTACQTGSSPQTLTPITVCLDNSFTIIWVNALLAAQQEEFNFVLTQINNKSAQFPSYTTAS